MEARDYKIILLTIVVVNALGWIPLSLFGVAFFAHSALFGALSFLFFLACLLGLGSISFALYSGIKFPEVSGFSVINFFFGYALILVLGFIGLLSYVYIASVVTLGIAGFIVTRQYWLVHNKQL